MVKIKIRSTRNVGVLEKFMDSVLELPKRIGKFFRENFGSKHRKELLFKLEQQRQEEINSKKIAFKIVNHKKHILKVRVG